MLSYWHTIVRWAGPVNIYWKCKLFGTIQPHHWKSSHLNPASHWLWKVTTLSWCDGTWFVISNDNMMTWEQSTVHTDIRLTNTVINHMRIISRLLLWHGNFSKDTKLFKRNLVKRWGADGVQSLQLTSLSNIFCFSQNWDQPIFYCSSLFSTSIYHWFLNLLNIKIWNPCFNWILEFNLIEFNTKDFKYVLKLGWNTFEFGAKRSRNNVLSG